MIYSTARQTIETAAVICAWFILNIAMASSTKWIFMYGDICDAAGKCKKFEFPLAITVIHMIFSFCMCCIHIFAFRGGLGASRLTFRQQAVTIAPLASCFALSVAMGNLSLKYIFPSFNQMLGAMSPLITVLMAVGFQSKQYNRATWYSMPVICGGLMVCSYKETNFHFLGACFCIGATILRGMKSLIQGKILEAKMDSVTLLFYMAPWAAAVLSVFMLMSEGTEPITILLSGLVSPTEGVTHVIFLLIISGLNACLLNVTNFLVTSYTSAVTLQVLGNVKSCLSIGISVCIFKNDLLWEQALGVITCLTGVWFYNQYGGTVKKHVEKEVELPKSAVAAAWKQPATVLGLPSAIIEADTGATKIGHAEPSPPV